MSAPAEEPKSPIMKIRFVLEALAAGTLVYSFISFLLVMPLFWNFPYQLNFTEGSTLHGILNAQKSMPLYPSLHDAPYVITNYFPFYYSFMAYGMKMFSHPNIFFYGRVLSFVSMSGVIVCLFLMLFRASRQFFPPLIFSLLSAFLITFRSDIFLLQINLPAVFFSLLGFYFFQKGERAGYLYLFSLLFFFLAVWTKQTMLAGFSACWLFSILRWKEHKECRFIKFFMAFPAFVLLAVLLEHKLTRGNFFLHVIYGNTHPLLFSSLKFHFTHFIKETWMVLAASALYLHIGQNALYKLYFLISLFFSFTVAKDGAGFVYFADLTLAMLLCAGCFYSEISKRSVFACLLVLCSLALPCRSAFYYRQSFLAKAYSLYTFNKQRNDSLSGFIREKKGEVLTEDADLSVLNGKTWQFDSPDMPLMDASGRWNSRAFLSTVKEKKYDCVIFYERFYSYRPLMQALEKSYRRLPLGESSGLHGFYVAVPK